MIDVENDIKELRNIINTLYFPKKIKYKYPNGPACYSPDTIYCTPPLESNIYKYLHNKEK